MLCSLTSTIVHAFAYVNSPTFKHDVDILDDLDTLLVGLQQAWRYLSYHRLFTILFSEMLVL